MYGRKVEWKRLKRKREEYLLASLSSADWYHYGCHRLVAAALGEKKEAF
jgi:hypothetical protein